MSKNKIVKNYYHEDKLNRGYSTEEVASNIVKEKPADNQGYLPPIEVISEYESIYPGSLEKILKLAEKEQEKRFLLEKTILASKERSSRLGKFFGVLIIAIICSTTYQIFQKEPTYSMIFASIAFLSIFLISILAYTKKDYRNQKNHRRSFEEKKQFNQTNAKKPYYNNKRRNRKP